MKYNYKTCGVCAKQIELEINDETGKIDSVEFLGGCNGNLQGISLLCQGQNPKDLINKLEGIKCGNKNSSCPDQLACALKQVIYK